MCIRDRIRPAEFCHDGGERVVVAQHFVPPGLNLSGGDGVVFIDHWDDAHFQKSRKGAAQMLRPLWVLHIVAGQKDLRHRAVVLGEKLVVDMHLSLIHI